MLYSGAWRLRARLSSCLVTLLLWGCGNSGGGHSASDTANSTTSPAPVQNSMPGPTSAKVTASANKGGYVTNQNASMFCDSTHEFCNYQAAYGDIESMVAISRYGYQFDQWQSNASDRETSASSMQLIADQDVSAQASFEKTAGVAEPACAVPAPSSRFRTLHLGDSLTAVQCWGNCPTYSTIPAQEPARESVRYYETSMASNTEAPRIIAAGGNRSIGTNFFTSSVADEPLDFSSNNYWRSTLEQHQESLDDFNAVVVALGSNDLLDLSYGSVDMDFIFEHRIRPLMQWLTDKPVLWILPHYSYTAFKRGNLNLYAKTDGIACSCGSNAPATTGCNLPQALEQCNATPQETRETIAMFKAVHLFRQRMLQLQDEFPNLRVVDAEQLVAQSSNGLYDLYQQLETDRIHFNRQGTEWYAWAQAYLAQSANAACAQAAPQWQMSESEITMMSLLESPL